MRYFSGWVVVLLLIFGGWDAYGQKQGSSAGLRGKARIDSLVTASGTPAYSKNDTNRVKILNMISFEYRVINPDEGLKYGEQALQLATRLDWKKGMATAYNSLGNNYQNKSDNTRTLECFQKALKINEDIAFKPGIAAVCGNIGILYVYQGNYPAAIAYNQRALKINEEIGNKANMANNIVNIGIVYQYQSNYPKALEFFFRAVKVYDEVQNKTGMASVLSNIGIIYAHQKDFPRALEYFFKALQTNEEIGNKSDIARNTGNIGAVYSDMKNYPEALEYYFKSLRMNEEVGNKKGVAIVTGDIGNVYMRQRNYAMAVEYGQAALSIEEEMGDKNGIASKLNNIAEAYLSYLKDTLPAVNNGNAGNTLVKELPSGRYEGTMPKSRDACLQRSVGYTQRALAIAKEINAPGIISRSYRQLGELYRLSGDYKKALEYAGSYQVIKDSIFSKENNEAIVKMGLKHEYEQQRLADSLKAAEKEKVGMLRLQRQRSYTYMGIVCVALLLSFSFFIVRERGKSEKERKKSEGLLLNILPAEVAMELKANGATIARHFDNVTVLFTDFVNFTQAGEQMSPQALIDELHTCFKAFDEITQKHGIEKIKTIGDAYLAVCGLPVPDPRHAENVVRAAIEMNAFMQDRWAKLGMHTFEMRIGIHSGNVVAGIVGVKKFAYDIWGDTVNTAARMEQHGEAGKINISHATYELVKDKFVCVYRGEIEAKNKGVMKMYYVE